MWPVNVMWPSLRHHYTPTLVRPPFFVSKTTSYHETYRKIWHETYCLVHGSTSFYHHPPPPSSIYIYIYLYLNRVNTSNDDRLIKCILPHSLGPGNLRLCLIMGKWYVCRYVANQTLMEHLVIVLKSFEIILYSISISYHCFGIQVTMVAFEFL